MPYFDKAMNWSYSNVWFAWEGLNYALLVRVGDDRNRMIVCDPYYLAEPKDIPQ